MARSALELRVSADRGVCLFVCTLTHSHGLQREIVSVLLADPLCETEACPCIIGFSRILLLIFKNLFFSN